MSRTTPEPEDIGLSRIVAALTAYYSGITSPQALTSLLDLCGRYALAHQELCEVLGLEVVAQLDAAVASGRHPPVSKALQTLLDGLAGRSEPVQVSSEGLRRASATFLSTYARLPPHTSRRHLSTELFNAAEPPIQKILATANPALLHYRGVSRNPVPVSDVIEAVRVAGNWPESLLQSKRLPQNLIYVRHTAGLMSKLLTSATYRAIAAELGIDHAAVIYGCNTALQQLRDGVPHTQDLFAAAMFKVLSVHPQAAVALPEHFKGIIERTAERHRVDTRAPD